MPPSSTLRQQSMHRRLAKYSDIDAGLPDTEPLTSSDVSIRPSRVPPYYTGLHGPSSSTAASYHCPFSPHAAQGVSFSRKVDLERHIAKVHGDGSIARFDCEQKDCHRRGSQGFSRKDKLLEHMREVHGATIPKRFTTLRIAENGMWKVLIAFQNKPQ